MHYHLWNTTHPFEEGRSRTKENECTLLTKQQRYATDTVRHREAKMVAFPDAMFKIQRTNEWTTIISIPKVGVKIQQKMKPPPPSLFSQLHQYQISINLKQHQKISSIGSRAMIQPSHFPRSFCRFFHGFCHPKTLRPVTPASVNVGVEISFWGSEKTQYSPENERMSPENQWLVQMYFLLK